MGSEYPQHRQLHGFFFPLMAYGHMIPMFDMVRMFASRGVKATIITTPANASTFSNTAQRDRLLGLDINIQILRFPTEEAGVPQGCENLSDVDALDEIHMFFKSVNMLQQPLEQLLEADQPDFIVADMILHWATESAAKYRISRFIFHGTNIFWHCVENSLYCYKPDVTSDAEFFVVPGLPDKIEMTRLQVTDHSKVETAFGEMFQRIRDSEINCYGVLLNSFYELEPAYADHYRTVMGKRAWQIGPVSLQNTNNIDKAQRGMNLANSVLYICFGSLCRLNDAQLFEIAVALEEQSFSFSLLPEGFEEQIKGKGLIIREWAPQVLILDHPSIGGFMTHCGWNSTLEGISAGVPMITWPLFAEQLHNENLVIRVLKTGIRLGTQKWNRWFETDDLSAKKDEIKFACDGPTLYSTITKAINQLMGDGEEAKELRSTAKELSELARKAVEEGGSSYTELTSLLKELGICIKKKLKHRNTDHLRWYSKTKFIIFYLFLLFQVKNQVNQMMLLNIIT
ncbi:hypothetical protein MKX03_004704 [Papaver bracteatum]|nr:hypothetical protein MKX03_004704 [Papaver bracteatum]